MGLFEERVSSYIDKIPCGKITTYKEIALALRNKSYRAVGNALNKNKKPDKIKCCKVVKADGSIGGFAFGSEDKIKRLQKEGIEVKDGKVKDFEKRLHKFV